MKTRRILKQMKKTKLSAFLVCAVLFIMSPDVVFALKNPAAVYCEACGYKYIVRTEAHGEIGLCQLPNNQLVDAWKFLRGEIAQEFSYCAKRGYSIKTVDDCKKCSRIFSEKCAVCVLEDGREIEVTELMELSFREPIICGDGICGFSENFESCPGDCPSGSFDGYCDGVDDGICDPDCEPGEDINCQSYPGDIQIYSRYANINAQDANAEITVDYILDYVSTTQKEKGTYVDIRFLEYGLDNVNILIDGKEFNNPVFFNPGDIKEVHVTYNQDIKGTTLKGLNINPVLLFDGMQYSKRINFDNVKLLLPSGIKKLITSNIEYDSTSYGNRTAYYWNKKIVYPTSLNVRWSTIDADISIKKSVLTEIIKPDEVMIIEVIVENRGNKDVRDVVLYDTLSLLRFQPIEPMEDFEIENNMVATWKKQVDILKAKETRKFIYEIILKDPSVTALKPAVATFNNSLIGISNDIEIRNKICGNNICSQNETYEECPQDCPLGKDNHCDPKLDGICDPDCKPGEDPDCREKGTGPSINFGIKAGLNFANLSSSGSTTPVFDWTNRTGFCAGAYLSFKLSDYAAVQPEVLFSRKGLKEDQVITSTFNLDFIEIPLLLKFTLSPGGWISPCLSGGPFVAFKLSDNITTGVGVPLIKKFDYGIAFGGGFDLKLGGNTLTLEARYTMGLKNIADVPAGSNITVKSKVLSFMIGLEF